MINIVLDTNAIYDNWYLSGPNILLLEKLTKAGYCKLYLPEIVVMEFKSHFKKAATSYITKFRKYNGIFKSHPIEIPDLDAMYKEFEGIINNRFRDFAVEIIPNDSIGHNQVLSRLIEGRKPFKKPDTGKDPENTEKGYKDALIWEILLNKVIVPETLTVIITNNTNDFCDDKGALHPDLQKDVADKGFPGDSVQVCKSICSFVDSYAGRFLHVLDVLKDGKYDLFSIVDWFAENRDHFIAQCNKQAERLFEGNRELENPSVVFIEDPTSLEVKEIYSLEDNLVYIDVTILSSISVDVLVYKGDYYLISDKYSFYLLDEDWNDDYVFASVSLDNLAIDFSLTFNIDTKKVEDFEINGFSNREIFGQCKHCGSAIYNDATETCTKCGKDLF